jgi:tRNA pseudouridine synthase 10
MYKESVEDLISVLAIKMTKGNNFSFHGAGREDIDVKMLGNGRPFILEIINPINRNINLEILQNSINKFNKNKISVSKLKFVAKDEIKKIKIKKYKKTYRVLIYCKNKFDIEKLKKAALSLRGKTISQYTPTRVARRRANMIRNRKIYELDIESYNKNHATLIIKSESGTYIKELITGDDGKTKPNISDLIGYPCEVEKLDVINIKE